MFNRFAKHEDAFRDWRRDGMPGLKAESYQYIEFLTSPDDDRAARAGTLWPHQWDSFLRVVYAHDILGKGELGADGAAAQHRDRWRQDGGDRRDRRLAEVRT